MVQGREDSGSNNFRAQFTIGKDILDLALDVIRKQVERCDSPAGVMVHSSLVGGTGSGLMTSLIGRLSSDYMEKK
jgi:tubulin alpha